MDSPYFEIVKSEIEADKGAYSCKNTIKFIPFPLKEKDIYHCKDFEDNLPKCPFCGAMFNGYNIESEKGMYCVICCRFYDNNFKRNNAMLNNVFEYNVFSNSQSNSAFTRTEIIIISQSLLKTHPCIIEAIKMYTKRSSLLDVYAIGIIGDCISFLQFCNRSSIITFPDGIGDYPVKKLFTGAIFVNALLEHSYPHLVSMPNLSASHQSNEILSILTEFTKRQNANIHIICNYGDFSGIVQKNDDIFRLAYNGVRVSVSLISDFLIPNQSVIPLVYITGGCFEQYLSQNTKEITDGLFRFMNTALLHDVQLNVYSLSPFKEIVGQGIVVSKKSSRLGKIERGKAIYLSFDINYRTNLYIQFIVYYKSSFSSSKAKVITIHLENQTFTNDMYQYEYTRELSLYKEAIGLENQKEKDEQYQQSI